MTRMIKTGRQDIYTRHVESAATSRDGDEADSETTGESDGANSEDYFFQ